MSLGFDVLYEGTERDEYTVKILCGCRLFFGTIPIRDFSMLAKGFSKKAIIANDIASRIGATFVIGEPNDIEDLRKLNLPPSQKRRNEHHQALEKGLPEVTQWLLEGDRGLSSEALCYRFFGLPVDAGNNYPRDPDDLNRCLKFLDAVDGHKKIEDMRGISRGWDQLLDHWDEIVAVFNEEKKLGDAAPKTYKRMEEVLRTPK